MCVRVCICVLAAFTNVRSRDGRQVGTPCLCLALWVCLGSGSLLLLDTCWCCQAINLGALGTSFPSCPVLRSVSVLPHKQLLNRPPLSTSGLLPCEGHHHSGQDSALASSSPLQLILHTPAREIDRQHKSDHVIPLLITFPGSSCPHSPTLT